MSFVQHAERFLELPDGALSREPRLEIVGARRLTLDGACDIIAYEPDCIRLKTRSGELRIAGVELNMEHLYAGGATVGGQIVSVEFLQ